MMGKREQADTNVPQMLAEIEDDFGGTMSTTPRLQCTECWCEDISCDCDAPHGVMCWAHCKDGGE